MKANELTILQKYIWKRNSEVSHEVIYLGVDESGKFAMYEFEYIKEGEKKQTLLSVHHVESDISEWSHILEFQELGKILKERLSNILFFVSSNRENISKDVFNQIVKYINLSNMNLSNMNITDLLTPKN